MNKSKKLLMGLVCVLLCASTFAKVWSYESFPYKFHFFKDDSIKRLARARVGYAIANGLVAGANSMSGGAQNQVRNDGLIAMRLEKFFAKDEKFSRDLDYEIVRRNYKGSSKLTIEDICEIFEDIPKKKLLKNVQKCDYMYIVLDDGLFVVENRDTYYVAAFYDD